MITILSLLLIVSAIVNLIAIHKLLTLQHRFDLLVRLTAMQDGLNKGKDAQLQGLINRLEGTRFP